MAARGLHLLEPQNFSLRPYLLIADRNLNL